MLEPSCEACQYLQRPCVYSESEDYKVASLSVQQAKWQSYGLNSSGEYLQHLFQDGGPISHEATINNEPQTTHS